MANLVVRQNRMRIETKLVKTDWGKIFSSLITFCYII